LTCNRCGEVVGAVRDVSTLRHSSEGPALETVRNIMREHEVEKHGGLS
jgi:hypothetical protein